MRALTMMAFVASAMGAQVKIEGLKTIPGKWQKGARAAQSHKLELTFGVRQRNTHRLEAELMRVSDPDSKDYGKHLSHEQVHAIIAPAPEDIAAVEAFIRSNGGVPKRVTPSGDFITADVTVAQAEKMLAAEYHQYTHPSTSATVHRATAGYSLPDDVAAAVDLVAPTTHLPGITKTQKAGNLRASGYNTPKNLRSLYNVGDAEGKAKGNKQAVTAFLEQYYSESALKDFWSQYCDGITCGKGLPKLVGDATTGNPGTESMLDIETITGLAGNVESEFWGFSGRSSSSSENEPYLKWLQQTDSTSDADVPKIFSTSYGEDEASWPLKLATRLNTEFQKSGARGITLLYASGDEGANCEGSKFVPETPGSSPYVTAVGGTQPGSNWPSPGAGSEEAIGLSSGGFSDYWVMPQWQKQAVTKYLQNDDLPPASRGYNTSNRAYPDIAAQATDFCVTPVGCGVAGTSCASPTAAAVFSLVNDYRLQNGKSTLGFINPLIYKSASAFNDITEGSGSGCGLFSSGWPAKVGWDAVTGLGTPDYQKLIKLAMSLP